MGSWRRLLGVILALPICGCSIYPLPEDVMPFDSDKIALVVRCQVRDALRDVIRRNIAAETHGYVYDRKTSSEMLDWLDREPDAFRKIEWKRFSPRLSAVFLYYKDTAVSIDFTVDGTETNTAGVNLTLLKKLTAGSDNLGLVAQNDRTREAKRHFQTFDTFDSLARLMDPRACYRMPQEANYLYPTVGLLRINSLVDSFLIANQWGNLSGPEKAYTTAEMTDTLTFTTKWTGNFAPSTSADPTIGRWIPTSASLNFDNSRQDLHTIIILLSLPPDKKGLPAFDEFGRILPPGAAGARVAGAAGLARARSRNFEDAVIERRGLRTGF